MGLASVSWLEKQVKPSIDMDRRGLCGFSDFNVVRAPIESVRSTMGTVSWLHDSKSK